MGDDGFDGRGDTDMRQHSREKAWLRGYFLAVKKYTETTASQKLQNNCDESAYADYETVFAPRMRAQMEWRWAHMGLSVPRLKVYERRGSARQSRE